MLFSITLDSVSGHLGRVKKVNEQYEKEKYRRTKTNMRFYGCMYPCAFFIRGGYLVALARIGVPVFLMISGYFYKEETANSQIRRIMVLLLSTNLLYFLWLHFYSVISGKNPNFSLTAISVVRFVFFNESPFAGHLWYLGAILYTRVVYLLVGGKKWRKALYYFTPFLLLGDLILGKYSLLFLHREFPYIIVRNWLFVGIPYFTIGLLMNENNFRIGIWGIPVFSLTTFIERWLLETSGMNAARDHYISTTFLAVAVFSFALEYKGKVGSRIEKAGRVCSTGIYIVHPIFITCYAYIIRRFELETIWGYIAPVIVFTTSLAFVTVFHWISMNVKSKRCFVKLVNCLRRMNKHKQ